jgi:hypothetical protein
VHNITQNLEAEFNEADLLPKTKKAAIMATCGICGAWRSKELGCFKAQLTKGAKRYQEELSRQLSSPGTQQWRDVYTRFCSCRHLLGLQVQRFVEQ